MVAASYELEATDPDAEVYERSFAPTACCAIRALAGSGNALTPRIQETPRPIAQ